MERVSCKFLLLKTPNERPLGKKAYKLVFNFQPTECIQYYMAVRDQICLLKHILFLFLRGKGKVSNIICFLMLNRI